MGRSAGSTCAQKLVIIVGLYGLLFLSSCLIETQVQEANNTPMTYKEREVLNIRRELQLDQIREQTEEKGKVLQESPDMQKHLPHLAKSETRKFATSSKLINCVQKPLTSYGNGEVKWTDHNSTQPLKFAYVWYAASAHYLCSAIAAMKFLRESRLKDPFQSDRRFDVRYVLVYVPGDLRQKDDQDLLKVRMWPIVILCVYSRVSLILCGCKH